MQSARPRATLRSRRSTCAGRRARSSSVKVRAQLSQLGRRSYRTGFSKRVRSYERTCVPAWQTQRTNSGHGLPDGHLHGACLPPWPHWDVSERRWLYPESRPQRANFVMPPRPRGAIGRPRAAPGRPPMAVGGMNGPRARGRISRLRKGVKRERARVRARARARAPQHERCTYSRPRCEHTVKRGPSPLVTLKPSLCVCLWGSWCVSLAPLR